MADELEQFRLSNRISAHVAESAGGHGALAILGGVAGQDNALDVGVGLANPAQQGDAVRLATQVLVNESHVVPAVAVGDQSEGGAAVGGRVHIEVAR